MTRAAKIFWLGYFAWVALIGAAGRGWLPWRWYSVLAAPFVVSATGLLLWTAGNSLVTAVYNFRAWFVARRR